MSKRKTPPKGWLTSEEVGDILNMSGNNLSNIRGFIDQVKRVKVGPRYYYHPKRVAEFARWREANRGTARGKSIMLTGSKPRPRKKQQDRPQVKLIQKNGYLYAVPPYPIAKPFSWERTL